MMCMKESHLTFRWSIMVRSHDSITQIEEAVPSVSSLVPDCFQSLRSSCIGSPTPCTTLSSLLSWRLVETLRNSSPSLSYQTPTPGRKWTFPEHRYNLFADWPLISSPLGVRAPAAAGADPACRWFLGQSPEGVPAHEAHAGPQPDHGCPAEVPTVPHWRQAVGHVGIWVELQNI